MNAAHTRNTWFNPDTGKIIDFHDLMHQMVNKEVVLLGETHDIAEIHRWQMHVIAALHMLRKNLMVGFEMFPKALQSVLDEWVDGKLDTKAFIKKSEWNEVWGFPEDIYLPIFHFCRQHNIRMLALNCSRTLVTRVGIEGWENIPVEERDGLTPAAPATENFMAYLRSYGAMSQQPIERSAEHFVRAQQTWDRAFACNIAYAINNARKVSSETPLVVGIIGRGHMEYGHGTPYQLSDLGIHNTGVLLTANHALQMDEKNRGLPIQGIADAICHIDTPEPPAKRRARAVHVENTSQKEFA